MKRSLMHILVVCGLLVAGTASAKNITVTLPMSSVDSYANDRGSYYAVSVSVPADVIGKRLDTVLLEFAVNATATEDSAATPVVGVYPLKRNADGGISDAAGRIDTSAFEAIVPSARPVACGENRIVRVDITDIVKGWIKDPSSNHGLVFGSLTGPSVGTVTLKDQLPSSDGAIQLTFFYQNRFGDRISERNR
ncbi:MAG TPA: hypothetical protein VF247_06150 [Candidatus Krumholzibacteria bacterium]